MLAEPCVENYCTLDGVVNCVNETLEECTKNVSKPLIWINFHNPCIGFNIRLENSHIYKEFPTLYLENKSFSNGCVFRELDTH
jgi:hypothetical protein